MAQEWQSLLQQAPNIQNLDLAGTFTKSYQDALSTRKNAYDFYRTQKAQEIAAKASRPDGSMDWDTMFKLGNEAGLGLDAFEQVQKMQAARRASELAVQQQRMSLESMGYDPTKWDPSAGPSIAVKAGGTPYEGPSANDYGFVTGPAETQIPQAPAQQFGAQGVGETAQTSMAPSGAPAPVAQDVVGPNEVVIRPNELPTSGTFKLPELVPDWETKMAPNEGYYNQLWRAQRDPEALKRMLGSMGAGTEATGPTLSTQQMKPEELSNLARYTALRGIAAKDPQEALTALENMAVGSVAVPQLNPMLGMLSKDEQAKEWGRYQTAIAEYPAKVQEARNKLSEAIRTGNYDVLEKQMAQDQLALSKQASARQQAEFERDRASANKLKEMGVTDRLLPSADVKALQDVFIPAIADISNAGNGFGGAMQAAIAKAKVDGTVNMDAVLSNLVSMGAMPSDQGAKIMAKMTPEAYTNFASMLKAGSVDQVMSGLRAIGIDVGTGTGATNPTWKDQALDNVFQQAQAHGMTESYYNKQRSKSWQSASPVEVLSSAPNAPRPRENKAPARTGWYKDADGVMRKH